MHIFDIINRLNYVKRFPLMSSLQPQNEKHEIAETAIGLLCYFGYESARRDAPTKFLREDLLLNVLFGNAHKAVSGGFIKTLTDKSSPVSGAIERLRNLSKQFVSDSVPFDCSAIERGLNLPDEYRHRYIKPIENLVKLGTCNREISRGNTEFKKAKEDALAQHELYKQNIEGFENFAKLMFKQAIEGVDKTVDEFASMGELNQDGLMFYASRLNQIIRWDNNPTLIDEDVKQHVADVAMYSALLTGSDNEGCDLEYIIGRALLHDITEAVLSDIPSNVKAMSPEMVSTYQELELLTARKMLNETCNEVAGYAETFVIGDKKKRAENKVVHVADKLAAYTKSLEELKLSNRYFMPIEAKIREGLIEQENEVPVLKQVLKTLSNEAQQVNAQVELKMR